MFQQAYRSNVDIAIATYYYLTSVEHEGFLLSSDCRLRAVPVLPPPGPGPSPHGNQGTVSP